MIEACSFISGMSISALTPTPAGWFAGAGTSDQTAVPTVIAGFAASATVATNMAARLAIGTVGAAFGAEAVGMGAAVGEAAALGVGSGVALACGLGEDSGA